MPYFRLEGTDVWFMQRYILKTYGIGKNVSWFL